MHIDQYEKVSFFNFFKIPQLRGFRNPKRKDFESLEENKLDCSIDTVKMF